MVSRSSITEGKDMRVMRTVYERRGKHLVVVRSEPAYKKSGGLVTQTMINEHGSYKAARAWLDSQKAVERPAQTVVPLKKKGVV